MMVDFKELREQLTDETIKDILSQFDVEPFDENDEFIIFPTCDHNLDGGSPKLYYYKNSKLFVSYTDNNGAFDIFTLLQKMMELRGKEITLKQAIELCDLDTGNISDEAKLYASKEEIRHMQELNNTYVPNVESNEFKSYDKDVLRKFTFDYMGLMPWIQEGMTVEALQKFNIKYDNYNQAIVIPNFDYKGNLIGIRARFFKPEDVQKGKYRPLYINGQLYNHPTGRTFYGIYENKAAIERKHIAVIFEGKRSNLPLFIFPLIRGVE